MVTLRRKIEGMGGLTEKVSRGEVGRRAGAELDLAVIFVSERASATQST